MNIINHPRREVVSSNVSCYLRRLPTNHAAVASAILMVIATCLVASVSAQENPRIPPDEVLGKVHLHRGPYEKEGPGALARVGYVAQNARFTRASYQSETERLGEVNVQIAAHPGDYPYVAHDFYGVFIIGPGGSLREARTAQEPLSIKCVERSLVKSEVIHYLCHSVVDNPPGDSGIFGWISKENENTVTVLIAYEHLTEIPWVLIDRYLERFPSQIAQNDPRSANWYADDIAKWTTLLQSRGNEDSILSSAKEHLYRLDGGGFGINDVWVKRDDPAARSAGVQAAIERMNEWLQDRQRAQNQNPEP